MGTFSYTKEKKLSMGNRVAYIYTLTNVQTTGSVLYTPFKKIMGYIPTTTSPATNFITAAASERTPAGTSSLAFTADAESQGQILVWGLL